MAKGARDSNTFAYTEAATREHLLARGIDEASAFHTVVSLSPLPRHINKGFTAWSNGMQSANFYVMKCNPQVSLCLAPLIGEKGGSRPPSWGNVGF